MRGKRAITHINSVHTATNDFKHGLLYRNLDEYASLSIIIIFHFPFKSYFDFSFLFLPLSINVPSPNPKIPAPIAAWRQNNKDSVSPPGGS